MRRQTVVEDGCSNGRPPRIRHRTDKIEDSGGAPTDAAAIPRWLAAGRSAARPAASAAKKMESTMP